MRVMVWPGGDERDATTQYRLLLPANVLMGQGGDIVIDTVGPTILWDRRWTGVPPPDAQAIGLAAKPDADVIVMQRPGRRWWADIIPMLQKLGIRVIVDVDDLFTHINPKNVAHAGYDPRRQQHHNYRWISEACRRADLVTCTTPVLREHYGYGHGMVIPNYVPERYLDVQVPHRPRTMGWSGTIASHPEDLQTAKGAVQIALDQWNWHFHVIGYSKGVQGALNLSEEPSFTGWVEFPDYPAALAELELGIVPLQDSRFNAGKSCLKSIELAAVGVATAVTATADNARMAELGVGVPVTHPSHWRKILKRLTSNPDLRADVAGRGREAMRALTYEKQSWRWGFAWGLDRDRVAAGAR